MGVNENGGMVAGPADLLLIGHEPFSEPVPVTGRSDAALTVLPVMVAEIFGAVWFMSACPWYNRGQVGWYGSDALDRQMHRVESSRLTAW
jgi:hypothetical protein